MYQEFRSAEAEVILVTPGSPDRAAGYARLVGFPGPVLADSRRDMYRRYGLDRMAGGLVQRSEVFVIDQMGVVCFAQGHGLPFSLPDVSEVLKAARATS